MAVSGVTTYSPAATFIITAAFRKLGVIQEGETPNANMQSQATAALNSMVKEWQASGIHVWTEEEAVLFLQPSQARYVISPTMTDHCCDAYEAVYQTLAVNASSGATTVTLEDASDVADGDRIGIITDDGPVFWTTVNGAPAGDVVTLTAALDADAASGNNVFAYTSNIVRPLRVPRVRTLNVQSQILTPATVLSHSDYMDLPNPNSTGIPTQAFYQPKLNTGLFFVWPTAASAIYAMRFTWYRPLDIFVSNADTADFPDEWNASLIFNLALFLAPDYGIPPAQFALLKTEAAEKLALVRGWDKEPESILMGVAFDPVSRGGSGGV